MAARSGFVGVRLLTSVLALLPTIALADVTGSARVIDGDTIEVAGQRIRLYGIDAPEHDQQCQNKRGTLYACGEIATRTLTLLISSQAVRCEERDHDRYGRTVAVCYIGRHDLGRQMVLEGWALAYRRYSEDYIDAERAARAIPEGMWKGKFIEPWEWRQGKRFSSPAANENQPPAATTTTPAAPPAAVPAPTTCCKVCRKGKACGNSCISRRYTCRKPPGCACNG